MEEQVKSTTRTRKRMDYATVFDINAKTPPQSIELEEAVLGALMLDQDALNNVIDLLHVEYFYKPENQAVFNAIHKLFERTQPVDLLTVVETLRQEGTLEAAGGAYRVSQLTNHITSGAHAEYYTRVLSEKFIQRELIRISTETIASAYDETTDVMMLLDKTEQHLMDINDKNFRSDYQQLGDLVSDAMDQINEARNSENSLSGLPTGLRALDQVTSGFHSGTLIILAARPAMGKTALAMTIARNMAVDHNIPVAFFSLEMPGVELAMRLISSEAEIDGKRLKKGDNLANWEQEKLFAKTQLLNNAPMYIDATPGLSIFELRAKCRRLKQRFGVKMIFIDYLQLMTAGGELGKSGNREQEISMISRQLKSLSKELDVPILALSQLSRAVETRGGSKKPILSDLRESGAIEQDADIVLFIHRPEYYGQTEDEHGSTIGMADILIAKHRSGETGEVRVKFEGQFVRFSDRDFVEPLGLMSGGGMSANEAFSGPQTMVVDSKNWDNAEDGLSDNDFYNNPTDDSGF